MAYKIHILPSALKELEAVGGKKIQRQIARRIEALAEAPRPPGAKKLKTRGDIYRIRSGNHRIVYQVRDKTLTVLVVKVGDRKEVYERDLPSLIEKLT